MGYCRALLLILPLIAAGCTGLEGADASKKPEEIPEKAEGFPSDMTTDQVPENVVEHVKGSDEGFIDRTGFFITVGEGVASLGDPTVTGVWVRAPFIKAEEELKIYSRDTDVSVLARALPYEGNMQMSLAAFQALSLNPAELVEVEVRTP